MDMQENMRNAIYPESFSYTWPFYIPDEIFIRISDYFPEVQDRYWVSNYGKVYDENYGILMKPLIQPNEYWTVTLQKKPGTYQIHSQHSMPYTIHKLVCTCFNGPKPGPKFQVNHINNIRCANWDTNLEWVTAKQNVNHSFIDGNRGVGENSNHRIFTEDVVRKICILLQNGVTKSRDICRIVFNSEPTQQYKTLIYNIKSRKFWKSVSKDYNF